MQRTFLADTRNGEPTDGYRAHRTHMYGDKKIEENNTTSPSFSTRIPCQTDLRNLPGGSLVTVDQ